MTKDGGQRIASSNGAMLADPAILGNPPGVAAPDVGMSGAAGSGAVMQGVAALDDMAAVIFDPNFWAARGELVRAARGRGAVWFIASAPHQWVLRHGRRGGLIARISADRYVWAGEKRVRAFAEWRLLADLTRRGLPVPKPVAARYQRSGIWYRCDLITERIVGAQPLSSVLAANSLKPSTWRDIGATVARFHAAGVDHADLNAHNILVDGAGAVSLIDFDRGKLRRPGPWASANLSRLHRSLVKISRDLAPDRFSAVEWGCILAGYAAEPVPPRTPG